MSGGVLGEVFVDAVHAPIVTFDTAFVLALRHCHPTSDGTAA